MADIDIVPKRRSSTWMWVILALVVLAVVLWMTMGRADVPPSGSLRPTGAPVGVIAHGGSPELV